MLQSKSHGLPKPGSFDAKRNDCRRAALNGAQVIVDDLIQEKVAQVVGLCGHGNIQLIDAMHERSSQIETTSVHHECVAGFMADVYYRVSGRPTATSVSSGPGAANLPMSLVPSSIRGRSWR